MNGSWEKAGPELIRFAVPAGWVYRLVGTTSICFVPNPALMGGVNPPAPLKLDTLERISAELDAEFERLVREA